LLPVSVHHIHKVIHERLDTVVVWGRMFAYVDLARAVLAGIRMQASNCMKVQCLDDVGRQERALRSQCSAHYGLQEVVLPIAIGDF
jgi:hypothetical protein